MIKKKKKKNNNIKFLYFLENLSFKYKKQVNNILDITIIEDDQLRFLRAKFHKVHKKFKSFLNLKVINANQFKELDRYFSFINKEKFTSNFNSYLYKTKKDYKNLRELKFNNLKFKDINFIRLKTPNKFWSIQILKKIEKLKYKKYFNLSLNKKFSGTSEYKNIPFLNKKFLETLQEKARNYKLISNLIDTKSKPSTDKAEYIATLYYSDHFLFITKLWKSSEDVLNVEKVIELPVPASVIGDDLINNVDELIELSLDSFEVLNLKNPPILIVLSSSFFTIKSFKNIKSNEFSENDEIIQSKSPYLPQDTLIDIQKVNDSLFNVIFTRKSLINGWINTLRKINYPVVGITTPGPHQIDFLRENKKIINQLEIIVDIELNSTTLFISNRDYELSSHKIPYGSILYRKKELVESYFSRLIKSIKLLTNDIKLDIPETIYVTGFGLDDFDYKSEKLPYPFVRFSELNKTNFKFNKKSSEDLLTTEINSKLNTILGITNKCL